MFDWLFKRKKDSKADEGEVIRVIVRRSPTKSGEYTYEMGSQGGPSDVVCMANDISRAVEHIVHSHAVATHGIRAYDRDLNNMLHKISYGAHFVLEYDGTAFRQGDGYGKWRAQFYDGFQVEGGDIWQALEGAWNVLPNKPNPFYDSSNFSPSGGQITE